MQQVPLLVGPWESFLEALRDDIQELGGPKAVGEWFLPEKSIEVRRNFVNDRLNAERRERFSDEQVELIMRKAVQKRGYSAAHWHRCDVLATDRPPAIRIEDERDRMRKAFVSAVANLGQIEKRMRELGVELPRG